MLTIACVKAGERYSAEYVNILYDSCRRNLSDSVEGRFVCLTDDPTGLNPEIESIALPANVRGWWAKLALFKPGVFSENERVLYFDLDMVIVSGIDKIAAYDGPFAILRDVYRPNGLQSSCMAWAGGTMEYIWKLWDHDGRPELIGGDQEWIERMVPNPVILNDRFPGSFLSYKADVRRRAVLPRGARVIDFHGQPKPPDAPEAWVQQIWKVGGVTSADVESVCNTANSKLLDHIRLNADRDLPWLKMEPRNEREAVIVGGGPTVKQFVNDIARHSVRGATVYALNGAAAFLDRNRIGGYSQVVLDARAENVRFLSPGAWDLLLASQCDPSLFERAAEIDRPAVVWHAHIDEIDEALPQRNADYCLIAGGSTVLLSAMCIAYAAGHRIIHIYGGDSSFEESGAHHAYPQPENDADPVVEATAVGRTFKTTPWMVAQVQQFQVTASELANAGVEIVVHGDSLLAHVARNMASQEAGDKYKRVNGDWWPAEDRGAIASVYNSLADLDDLLPHIEGRKAAFQAGGNVGIWARRLAQEFAHVVTVEPDADNYQCLLKNTEGVENVHAINAALAETSGSLSLVRDANNCGAHFVQSGGDVQAIRIDDLALQGCDFLALDIEGYELAALKGAERTIRKFRPVILIEDKGLSERFGVAQGEAVTWLCERGYVPLATLNRDVVLRPAA